MVIYPNNRILVDINNLASIEPCTIIVSIMHTGTKRKRKRDNKQKTHFLDHTFIKLKLLFILRFIYYTILVDGEGRGGGGACQVRRKYTNLSVI